MTAWDVRDPCHPESVVVPHWVPGRLSLPIVPTWEVRAYPTGALLHIARSYEDADNWRLTNHQASVIVPHWVDPQVVG